VGGRILLRDVPIRPGTRYTEYEYRSPPFYVEYVVGYQAGRLVMVTTHLRRHRTRDGIGVGTTLPKLQRTYRRALECRELFQGGTGPFYGRACVLGSQARSHVVFIVPSNPIVSGRPPPPVERVSRVMVRSPGLVVSIL
jgi:hypothetical protein